MTVGHLPQTGIFGMNHDPLGPGGVEGIVLLLRWENASEVLARIHEAVDELNRSRLPQGVKIVPIHDRTELVESTLQTISRVLIEGFAVVVLVLLFFLVSLRAALLTAIIIPLSLLFAFLCMYLSGVTLSLLSIGALDFGILVDATIVMVERIVRTLEEGARSGPTRSSRSGYARRASPSSGPSLLAIDHHRRVHPSPYPRAGRAAALHADGADGLLRATRIPSALPHPRARARDLRVPGAHSGETASVLDSVMALYERIVRGDGAARRADGGRCVRRRYRVRLPGDPPWHRVHSAARRRRDLDPGEPALGDLARGIGQGGGPDALADPAITGGETGQLPERTQRLRYRSVWAEPQRDSRDPESVQHLDAR